MLLDADLNAALDDLLSRAPADREAALRSASDALREMRLRRVLQEMDDVDPFLRPGGALDGAFGDDLADDLARDEGLSPGEPVGPYRIVSEIGRGGMAIVYLAERADGAFSQQVALKIVRRGIDTDETLARFRQERQILASLEHPGIARLIDGGVTEDGRPYLAMELVAGEPLDRYCAHHQLDVNARIDLCIAIARIVQHAHRRLVVHRDLKPGNVLVTPEGGPRLLDFGIAKLLDPATFTAAAPATRPALRLMTPEYASPEQLSGETITTASDVYQMGLILFEVLTGCRPRHAIREQKPPRPSAAISGTDAHSRQLRRTLRGDLDNILLKALNGDPERRYASVEHLADDLVRYRRGLPVFARGESWGYRATKFFRRHRVGVGTAALLATVVIIGTLTTWTQARIAAREGQRASQIRDFLVSVFEISDPDRSRGEAVTARELLDRGSERVSRALSSDEELHADMLGVLGTLYRQLGLWEQSGRHFEDALRLRRASGGAPHLLVDSLTNLATVRNEMGATEEASRLILEALELARGEEGPRGPTVASVLTDLASVHKARGEFEAAESRSREALAIRRTIGDPGGLADTLNGLGVLLNDAGRSADSIASLEEALTLGRQAFGDGHTKVILTECNLARARHSAGQLDPALAAFQRCVEQRRRLLGDRHPDVGLALNNMALVHSERNEYDAAERQYLEALAIQRAAYGEHHRSVAGTLNNMAILAFQRRRYSEAADRFRELVGTWRILLGPDHPDTLSTTNNLGMALRSAGQLAEAEQILSEVLSARVRALGRETPQVAESLLNLATVVHRRARFAQARTLAQEALALLERLFPNGHPQVSIGLMTLGRAQLAEGSAADALASFDRALALRTTIYGAEHLQSAESRGFRGRALAALGRVAEGRGEIETALRHLAAGNHSDSQTARDATEALAALPQPLGAR